MNNLFNFEYQVKQLKNQDQTDSRFSVVYGDGGNVMHCKKDSYSIIKTADVSTLAQAFINQAYEVKTFSHRNGEVIGLNIPLSKNKLTAIGHKKYNAIITIPNNGGGKGYLSIHEVRLICTNGMTRTKILNKEAYIKIPHTIDYNYSLKLLAESVTAFDLIIKHIEAFDKALDQQKLSSEEARRQLSQWFFENEMPAGHKKDMTLDDFRKAVYMNPDSVKCIDRFEELMGSFRREREYNEILNLELSHYTVYASVTNYLSRRIEASKSTAPKEIQNARQSAKLECFNKLATV